MLVNEIKEHLTKDLIPFWESLKDDTYGGFYGGLDFDLHLDQKAVKGCILNSRILWFFSNAYLILGEESLLPYAHHAYHFLKEACLDQKNGGVYWSLTYDGQVADGMKHTYNQAFAIYALSSYYDAVGDEEALQLAFTLQNLIETVCVDEYGYLEAFDETFRPVDNEKLSENGVCAEKTMNTLLHVFEAYTELYRVTGDEKTGNRIRYMMDLIADKIYNKELGRQEVFFDRAWNSLIDLYSYGHDIETAWLVDRSCEILNDEAYTKKMSLITKTITANIYEKAYVNHSLLNECERGVADTTRVWWIQAEAIVGFLNGYEKTPENTHYLQAVKDIWDYIKTYMIDKREGSEWFWSVDENGNPIHKPIVEPWKCPYHNGRMCFEVIKRTRLLHIQ